MRKLVVIEYVSLDGVIQAPGHAHEDPEGDFAHGGWTGQLMPDHERYNSDSFQTAGAFLFGRLIYDIWAQLLADCDRRKRRDRPRTEHAAEVHRLAHTRRGGVDGTTIIRHVPREVAALKQQGGMPIFVMGSSNLAQTLIAHDLIDEYELWLHPIVLGTGKKLFRDGNPKIAIRLVDCRTTANGLVILTYERTAQPAPSPAALRTPIECRAR